MGVPFTVIIFTNFGRYIQNLEGYARKSFIRFRRKKKFVYSNKGKVLISRSSDQSISENEIKEAEEKSIIEEKQKEEESEETEQISALTLVFIVLFYLVIFLI